MKDKLQEIKLNLDYPNHATNGNGQEELFYMVIDTEFNWLIQEVERLRIVEQAYRAYMKAR